MKKHTLAIVMSLMCGLFLGAQSPQQTGPSNQTSFASIDNLSDRLETIENYYKALVTGDSSKWTQLFTSNAMTNHPIYGSIPASQFLKTLRADRPDMKIVIKNIFLNPNNSDMIAAHFLRSFSVKGEGPREDEIVEIFTFAPQSNKIQSYTTIYDSQKTREAVQKNKGAQ